MTCGDTFNGQCQKSRYRSFDGTCNNLYNPTWGAANTRYGRLLLPNYADGKEYIKLRYNNHIY